MRIVVSQLACRRSAFIRFVRTAIPVLSAVSILTALGLGGFQRSLFQQPDVDPFFERYFEEPFLFFIVLLVLWFMTASIRNPSRMEESRYLNSLAISHKEFGTYFIVQDMKRYAWVLIGNLALYGSMHRLAPAPFLFRAGILSIQVFALSVMINLAWQCTWSIRDRRGKSTFPIQNDPVGLFVSILCFAMLQWTFLIKPAWISGYCFWIIYAGSCLCMAVLCVRIVKLFQKWIEKNSMYSVRKSADQETRSEAVDFMHGPSARVEPMLMKNVLKTKRQMNGRKYLVTFFFITAAYLVSSNNLDLTDRSMVLLGLGAIYSYLFTMHHVTRFSREEEPDQLLYALPIQKRNLYLSGFLPAWMFLAAVNAVFALLIFISSVDFALSFMFWLKSAVITSIFCLMAMNSVMTHYPDARGAERSFVQWTFGLFILTAVFLKFYPWIIGIILLASFVKLRKVHLYRQG